MNFYFDQKEKADQNQRDEIKRFDKGPYHLYLLLNDAQKAKKIERILEAIKTLLRKERAKEV